MSAARRSSAAKSKLPATDKASTSASPNAQTWEMLEQGVNRIMTRLRDGIDMKTYMGLYTNVHNFCTSQKGISQSSPTLNSSSGSRGGKWTCWVAPHEDDKETMPKRLNLSLETFFGDLENSLFKYPPASLGSYPKEKLGATSKLAEYMLTFYSAHLLGEELYQQLTTYLDSHLIGVYEASVPLTNEALLTYYIKEWDRYTSAAKYVNHVFRYLNRHWVKREVDEGKKSIYDVYTLHLVRWKEVMFEKTHEAVMQAVLSLVRRQRDGETIEHSQIKSVVDSFCALGIDENDSTKTTLDVYKVHFEAPYLLSMTDYYHLESREFLANNSVVEYMKKAEARLEEEKGYIPLFLHDEIKSPLHKRLTSTLIEDHAVLLRDEFQILLNNDRIEDMGRMYKLLQKIPGGLDPLRTRFEKHVTAAGKLSVLQALEKAKEQAKEDGKADSTNDKDLEPKSYVDALLAVHTQYADLVQKAFSGESEFVRSLDSACREYVNHNQVCEKATQRSPELLAKYTDTLLKRQAKTAEEDDLEQLLTQIMTIFKYIDDKDVFQKFYSRMLAKRLVGGLSASEDAETNMIGKLKEACGFEYTNKLQRMFQDMQTSKDLNSSYKDHRQQISVEKEGIDATFQVLGTGFWPLTAPTTKFTPPTEILKAADSFKNFYLSKHSGRKLTWLWQHCKGEIRANHLKVGRVPVTIQVTTYGLAILLCFNDAPDGISYEEIAANTNLQEETLDPSIALFVKAKIIIPEPANARPQNGTKYSLNLNLKPKKTRLNLQMQIKSETKVEVEDTHKTIEEDRKLLIQSAIVRIMKSRKKLRHQILLQETISQISQRFKPSVQDIKKCIDILLEKEYLERLENDELGYLA